MGAGSFEFDDGLKCEEETGRRKVRKRGRERSEEGKEQARRRNEKKGTNLKREGLVLFELDEKDGLLIVNAHRLALGVPANRNRTQPSCQRNETTKRNKTSNERLTISPS